MADDLNMIEKFVRANTDSTLEHYILPGLTSLKASGMKVRMFDMTREQISCIAPHSHRFNFVCMVLAGVVQNTVWEPCILGIEGDAFLEKSNTYKGDPGQYQSSCGPNPVNYVPVKKTYGPGDCYEMTFDQIHSIAFEKGAKVLFLEGPNVTDTNMVLIPWDGKDIQPTDTTLPWMFHHTEWTLK